MKMYFQLAHNQIRKMIVIQKIKKGTTFKSQLELQLYELYNYYNSKIQKLLSKYNNNI